jgi:hypothetical protein
MYDRLKFFQLAMGLYRGNGDPLANRVAVSFFAGCRGLVVQALNPLHWQNCSLLQPIAAFGEGSPAFSPQAAQSTTNARDGRRSQVRFPQHGELVVVEAGRFPARLSA